MNDREAYGYCEEIYPRIYKIMLPLAGKKPGPVNVYFLPGAVPTLIDTGTARSAEILRNALRKLGVEFRDIAQIILTHGHIDHYGAARKIAAESGGSTTIAAHSDDLNLIAHGFEAPKSVFKNFYRLMGAPLIFQISLRMIARIFKSMAQSCRISRTIHDGETIHVGDYRARVISTPGHTRGSVCLYMEREGVMFTGDLILGHITPNAFVMLEPDFELPVRLSQVEFYDSLDRVEKLSPRLILPAHGETITDLKETVSMYRRQFTLRQEEILLILNNHEYTVYRTARVLFPGLGGPRLPLEIYLAISEVYTHLQVLQKHGRVESREIRGALYFTSRK